MSYTHSLILNLRLSEGSAGRLQMVQELLYNASETTRRHYTPENPELSLKKLE